MESFEKLEKLLSYSFKNKELLIEALSHPSLRQHHEYKDNKDYERLEFLGDAVLNLVITEILFKNFANYNEGNLAKIRSYLVCKETICMVGAKLALKDYIIMTHGEKVVGGRDNPNNIENATEALIAAIYLDSNIETTHNIIGKLWEEFIKVQNLTDYDPKTALQEWAQASDHHLPIYRLIKREGAAHSSTFTVLVKVKDYEQTGTGHSIKEAEKNAARSLLYRLKMTNRHLPKPTYREEFKGDTECSTAAYTLVREDASTGSTSKLPLEAKFGKMSNQKTVSVCIIGRPNSGKSTLLNRIIGEKLSIVTPKVQTTRSIITGIITLKDTQVILYDTPGIFEPKGTLEKAMVRCAWSSLHSADLVLLIIDSLKPFDDVTHNILDKLCSLNIVPIFLLNKIDIESKYLNDIKAFLTGNHPDSLLFPISALSGKNIDGLLEYITSKAKISPWLYAEDDITDLPMRFIAAEITREQLFLNLQQELPYKLTVQTEKWEELKDKSVKINQVIVVSRESYKTIILGKNGSKIKEIGAKSRMQMERFFGSPVHLFLFVKVRELWENNQEFYQYMKI